jgi:hypothetical protein
MKTIWPGKRSIDCRLNAWLPMSVLAKPTVVQASEAPAFLSTVEVAGERLQLNGSGSRYKSTLRVCDAALYTRSPVRREQALHALPGAKRLHLVAVRDIRSSELVHLLVRAAIERTNGEPVPVRAADMAQIARRLDASVHVKRGDSFGFDFVPGSGTQVLLNGDPLGPPLADPALFQILLGPWLGSHAADAALKHALLGQGPPSAQASAVAQR